MIAKNRMWFVVMLIAGFTAGCCLTPRLWANPAVTLRPLTVARADTIDEDEIRVSIEYADDQIRPLRVHLDELEWADVGSGFPSRMAGAYPAPPYEFVLIGSTLYVKHDDESALVRCLTPLNWSAPATYGAAILTPLAAIVDIPLEFIHINWILLTVGGHGTPWVPWCDDPWQCRERLCAA